MNRSCHVCKKSRSKDPNLTLHKFPTDVVKRKKWCDLLGIYLPSYDVPKRAKACSDHFDDNDFRYCKDRRKLLNRNAYPKPWKSIDNSIRLDDPKPQPCTSKDVIFEYGTDDSMSGIENLPIDGCVSETILSNVLDVQSVSKIRPIAAEASIEEDETSSSSSSSTTLTASSTERQLLSLLKNNPDSLPENAVGPLSAFRGSLRLIEKRKNRRSAQAPSSSQTQPENKINTSDDNVIETIEIRTVNENAEDIENNLPAYVLVDNTLNGSTPENDIKIEIEDHELDTNFVPEEPNISRNEPSVEVNSNSQHPIQTFFDSISLTVMKFPPSLAVRAKMEVMKVISDLELELLTQQNSHSKV